MRDLSLSGGLVWTKMTDTCWSALWQTDLFLGPLTCERCSAGLSFWQATCPGPVCWRDLPRCSDWGKVQSPLSANARAALPPDGARESSFPLVCWQIAQLWCYMSALALRISRDKPGMFCMPDSGTEPLHWDNLLEGTVGPGWTRRVGNPLTCCPAAV